MGDLSGEGGKRIAERRGIAAGYTRSKKRSLRKRRRQHIGKGTSNRRNIGIPKTARKEKKTTAIPRKTDSFWLQGEKALGRRSPEQRKKAGRIQEQRKHHRATTKSIKEASSTIGQRKAAFCVSGGWGGDPPTKDGRQPYMCAD